VPNPEASGSGLSSSVEADLHARVKQGDVVLVVGAGVSVAATGANPVADWRGLIEDGIHRCMEVAGVSPKWVEIALEELGSNSPEDLLYPADKVTERLGGRAGSEYKKWLEETVGSLKAAHPGVIEALVEIGAPILTTNYDRLLEAVSGLETVTWRDDLGRIRDLLNGEAPGVLHLHGFWDQPESVVLGIRSYVEVMGDERAQAVQQAVSWTKSLVFVGFGQGLEDPNFDELRKWMKPRLAGSGHRHFRLVRASEVDALKDVDDPIRPLSYGASYDDLKPYLLSLAQISSTKASPSPEAVASVDYTGLVLGGFARGKAEVYSVAVSPDGGVIAAGTDGEILLFDTTRLRDGADVTDRIRPKRLSEPTSYVYSVAFGAGDSLLASGEQDGFVRLWDVDTRKQRWEGRGGHNDAIYSVAFAPDGKRLVSGGYDGKVVLWNVEKGTSPLSSTPISRVSSVAVSSDGRLVAIGYLDNYVRLWDTRGTTLRTLGEHASSVETVAFSPDGRHVASSGLDKIVRLWDVERREDAWEDNPDSGRGHEYLVRSVAFSPDGNTIASASWDKSVRLWSATDGSLLAIMPLEPELPWHKDWIWSVAFSDLDGMVLALGGSDRLSVWRIDESDTHRSVGR
jgi:WD40 repeat protein